MKISAALLTLLLAARLPALAVNDWSVPCIQGKCSWDPPDSAGSGSSRFMQIVSVIYLFQARRCFMLFANIVLLMHT